MVSLSLLVFVFSDIPWPTRTTSQNPKQQERRKENAKASKAFQSFLFQSSQQLCLSKAVRRYLKPTNQAQAPNCPNHSQPLKAPWGSCCKLPRAARWALSRAGHAFSPDRGETLSRSTKTLASSVVLGGRGGWGGGFSGCRLYVANWKN